VLLKIARIIPTMSGHCFFWPQPWERRSCLTQNALAIVIRLRSPVQINILASAWIYFVGIEVFIDREKNEKSSRYYLDVSSRIAEMLVALSPDATLNRINVPAPPGHCR